MGNSRWSKYDGQIDKMLAKGRTDWNKMAKELFGKKDKTDTLRTYIKRRSKKSDKKRGNLPKVLLFDLETAPILAYTWSLWPKSISTDMVKRDWFLFSWSGKWLWDDGMMSEVLTPKEAVKGDDKRIVKKLWKAFDEADVIIAHNLIKFDQKKANTLFFKHKLNFPSPYERIDTLAHLRKKFSITSNRLDYVAHNFLGLEGKMETPKGLWWRCYEGDPEALETMRLYCDQDIHVLESVYLEMRQYIQPHFNIGLHTNSNKQCCPTCGSEHLKHDGEYRTYVSVYDSFRCQDCGSLSRTRKHSTPKEIRERLMVSLPR